MNSEISSRQIWAVSLPLVFAALSEVIVDITDTAFLARLGTTELAAVGLADAIYSVAIVVTVGVIEALQIVMARRAGEGRLRQVGRTFNQALYLLGVVAVALTLFIRFGTPSITEYAITSASIRDAVDSFLHILAFNPLFDVFNFAYGALFIALRKTRVLIRATFVLALTNIVLDYALIFGNLGFPRMGIAGAALASLIAEIGMFGYLTWHTLRRLDVAAYGLFVFERWNGAIMRRLISTGTPVSLEAFVETVRWLLFFVIIERVGETALAMTNILYCCYIVLLIPIEGLAEATCSMVSHAIGDGKPDSVSALIRRIVKLTYAAATPLAIVVLLWPHAALQLFGSEPHLIEGATTSLYVIIVGLVLAVPSHIFYSAVSGTGDTVVTMMIEVVMFVTVLSLVYYVSVVRALPLQYAWASVFVGIAVCLTLAGLWLHLGHWKRLEI